jgi:hypothetical protein
LWRQTLRRGFARTVMVLAHLTNLLGG